DRDSTRDYEDSGRLRSWLIANAKPIEPNAVDGGSVDLERDASFRNLPGQPVGPFVVSTEDVATVELTATPGVTIIDDEGEAVDSARDGEQVWLHAVDPQRATLTASGTYVHRTGTIWVDPFNREGVQELTKGVATPSVRKDSVTVDL